MPVIQSQTLQQHQLPTGQYGYSAAKIDDLGATEYTLVTIVVDASSSVSAFKKELELMIQKIIEACKRHPRGDNLMVRLVQFATQNGRGKQNIQEIHGFEILEQIDIDNYENCVDLGRFTPLCDGVENAISSTSDWAGKLVDQDFSVNGAIYVITDGRENASGIVVDDVKKALKKAMMDEDNPLESLITVLIGVNIEEPQVSMALNEFKEDAGLTQFIGLKDAEPKTLAKLGGFISHSISATRTALGSGAPSQPLKI